MILPQQDKNLSPTSERMEWIKAVGTRRMHQRYVGLENWGYVETFSNLSEGVSGEGEIEGERHGYHETAIENSS